VGIKFRLMDQVASVVMGGYWGAMAHVTVGEKSNGPSGHSGGNEGSTNRSLQGNSRPEQTLGGKSWRLGWIDI